MTLQRARLRLVQQPSRRSNLQLTQHTNLASCLLDNLPLFRAKYRQDNHHLYLLSSPQMSRQVNPMLNSHQFSHLVFQPFSHLLNRFFFLQSTRVNSHPRSQVEILQSNHRNNLLSRLLRNQPNNLPSNRPLNLPNNLPSNLRSVPQSSRFLDRLFNLRFNQ